METLFYPARSIAVFPDAVQELLKKSTVGTDERRVHCKTDISFDEVFKRSMHLFTTDESIFRKIPPQKSFNQMTVGVDFYRWQLNRIRETNNLGGPRVHLVWWGHLQEVGHLPRAPDAHHIILDAEALVEAWIEQCDAEGKLAGFDLSLRFFSHRWSQPKENQPDTKEHIKAKCLFNFGEDLACRFHQQVFYWIDFACIDQNDVSLSNICVAMIPLFVGCCNSVLFFENAAEQSEGKNEYEERIWTRAERVCAYFANAATHLRRIDQGWCDTSYSRNNLLSNLHLARLFPSTYRLDGERGLQMLVTDPSDGKGFNLDHCELFRQSLVEWNHLKPIQAFRSVKKRVEVGVSTMEVINIARESVTRHLLYEVPHSFEVQVNSPSPEALTLSEITSLLKQKLLLEPYSQDVFHSELERLRVHGLKTSVYGRWTATRPNESGEALQALSNTPGRRSAFIFGPDSLLRLLQLPPYEFLLTLGLGSDYLWFIQKKRKFPSLMILFDPQTDVACSSCDWEGIAQFISTVYPEASEEVNRHLPALKACHVKEIEEMGGVSFAECLLFAENNPDFLSFPQFLRLPRPTSLAEVRLFLYCELRLLIEFSGTGMMPPPALGKEYIVPNFQFSQIQHRVDVIPYEFRIPTAVCQQNEMKARLKETGKDSYERIELLKEMEERLCHRLCRHWIVLDYVHSLIRTAGRYIALRCRNDSQQITAVYATVAGYVSDGGHVDCMAGRIRKEVPEDAEWVFAGKGNLRDTLSTLFRFHSTVLLPDVVGPTAREDWEALATAAGMNVAAIRWYLIKLCTWKAEQSLPPSPLKEEGIDEESSISLPTARDLSLEEASTGRCLESFPFQQETRRSLLAGGCYNLDSMSDQTKESFLALGGQLDGLVDNLSCEQQSKGIDYLPWICGAKVATYQRDSRWVQQVKTLGLPLLTGVSHSGARLFLFNKFLMNSTIYVAQDASHGSSQGIDVAWLNAIAITTYLVHIRAHTMHEVLAAIDLIHPSLHYQSHSLSRMIVEEDLEKVLSRDC
eukprot:gene8300-8977_t